MTSAPSPSVLRDLLARVKAATGPDRELDAALWWVLAAERHATDADLVPRLDAGPALVLDGLFGAKAWRETGTMVGRYTASVDAALGLVERAMPGWRVSEIAADDPTHPAAAFYAYLRPNSGTAWHWSSGAPPMGWGQTRALAILSALLGTLLAQSSPVPAQAGGA